MVKRLHFGRAAESGVLAAGLAGRGFNGPHDILEGDAGFLKVFCDRFDLDELVRGLDGGTFHVREISMKCFATHGCTQAPLKALLSILETHAIGSDDIAEVSVLASRECVENHDNVAPADLMQAQYSILFCIALACVRDVRDPRSLSEDALSDPAIRSMLLRVRLDIGDFSAKRTCSVAVRHVNGKECRYCWKDDDESWKPLDTNDVIDKYRTLMRDLPTDQTEPLLSRLQSLEAQTDLNWLSI